MKKLSFFRVFEDCVVSHITHEHSDVMKQKSVIVSRFELQTTICEVYDKRFNLIQANFCVYM